MTTADRHLPHLAHMPLWRRLSRWLGTAQRTRARAGGTDSARLDLGYEAAYAPAALADNVGAPSRFEDDRSAH